MSERWSRESTRQRRHGNGGREGKITLYRELFSARSNFAIFFICFFSFRLPSFSLRVEIDFKMCRSHSARSLLTLLVHVIPPTHRGSGKNFWMESYRIGKNRMNGVKRIWWNLTSFVFRFIFLKDIRWQRKKFYFVVSQNKWWGECTKCHCKFSSRDLKSIVQFLNEFWEVFTAHSHFS